MDGREVVTQREMNWNGVREGGGRGGEGGGEGEGKSCDKKEEVREGGKEKIWDERECVPVAVVLVQKLTVEEDYQYQPFYLLLISPVQS